MATQLSISEKGFMKLVELHKHYKAALLDPDVLTSFQVCRVPSTSYAGPAVSCSKLRVFADSPRFQTLWLAHESLQCRRDWQL